MKYAFIKNNRHACRVDLMAQMLNVSTSSYYRCLRTPYSARDKHYQKADHLIMKIFAEHKGRYGSTRIMEEMKDDHAFPIKRQTVSKRMQVMGLVPKARKKFKATTDSNHNHPYAKKLLEQNFYASAPKQKWVTDTTYSAPSLWRHQGRSCRSLSMFGMRSSN